MKRRFGGQKRLGGGLPGVSALRRAGCISHTRFQASGSGLHRGEAFTLPAPRSPLRALPLRGRGLPAAGRAGRCRAEAGPSPAAPLGSAPPRGCRRRLHALGGAVRSRGGAQPGGGSVCGAEGRRPRPAEAAAAAHGSAGGRMRRASAGR